MTGRPSRALPEKLWCMSEGRVIDIKDFYLNYSDIHESNYGRAFYCKKCSKEIANKIFKKYSNYQLCVIEMCAVFDLPYIPEVGRKLEEFEKSPINVNERDINQYFQYMKISTDKIENGGGRIS